MLRGRETKMSSLSDAIKRTSDALRLGASSQVSDYEQRFSTLRDLYDGLLSNLPRALAKIKK